MGNSTKNWFYLKNGQSKGPVSADTLAEMVVMSELAKDTPIIDPAEGAWYKIGDIPAICKLIVSKQKEYYTPFEADKELVASYLYSDKDLAERLGVLHKQSLFINTPWQRIPLYMLLSFGLYQFLWLIRQWYRVEMLDAKKQSIFNKFSIFILFAPFTLFSAVEGFKEFRRVRLANFRPVLQAILWYALIVSALIAPWGQIPLISPLLRFACFFAGMIPIMKVQSYINTCNRLLGRDGQEKDRA